MGIRSEGARLVSGWRREFRFHFSRSCILIGNGKCMRMDMEPAGRQGLNFRSEIPRFKFRSRLDASFPKFWFRLIESSVAEYIADSRGGSLYCTACGRLDSIFIANS
jgi:hypothetical protein